MKTTTTVTCRPGIDEAIRALIELVPSVSLVLDDYPGVVVVPVILTRESTTVSKRVGMLEYQVSDNVPGRRSSSLDVDTWEDVLKAAKELREEART
jgi:hypothetical protein